MPATTAAASGAGPDSSPSISDNTINGNIAQSGSGGGIRLIDGSATVSDNTITENNADADGAGISIGDTATPTITGNSIIDNSTTGGTSSGGGIACEGTSQSIITGNTISHNAAYYFGGGIFCVDAQMTARGNIVAGNYCFFYGGGIMCQGDAQATIDGDTVHYNGANVGAGGIYGTPSAAVTITNCIVWDNQSDDLFGVSATYSCISDGDSGTGNISSDPLFASPGHVDASSNWVLGDYHLKSAHGRWDPDANAGAGGWVSDGVYSPCIDKGDPSASYANEPAPNGDRRNMGAYGNTVYASKSNVNTAPSAPSSPVPSDGATDQPRTTDVSWTASTDPDGDAVTYDVYFGKDALPVAPVVSSQSPTTYDPGLLDAHSTYYWKIIARDGHGGITPGPAWSFGTGNAAPASPSAPSPADGATSQMHNVDLGWAASVDPDGDPVTYDVYFGKDSLPGGAVSAGQSATSYAPGLLEPGGVYHWKILAHDPYGAATPGPEWTFTAKTNTAPGAASGPAPANGASGQYRNVDLAWTASVDPDGDPVTYDVYLGVGSLPGTPAVSGLSSPGYDPGTLAGLSTYHWRVVSMDPFGGSTPGAEWTFTTSDNSAPDTPSAPSPADGATGRPVDVDLAWAACADPDGDPVTYDLYFGKDALPGAATASGLTANLYDLPHLAPNSTYHWRVVAMDDRGAQSPGPEWTFSTGGDSAAPSVVITYPTDADGVVTDDPVTVTGTADDSSQIEAVWVNGVRATPLSANYATWQATIAVCQGWTEDDPDAENTIVAAAVDEHGNFDGSADTQTVTCVGEHGMVGEGSLKLSRAGVLLAGDVDTFTLQAAAGTVLKLKLTGGKGGPALTIRIYDTHGEPLLEQTGTSLSLSPVLPQSGLYTVRLMPAGAGALTYKLSCSGKAPSVKLKVGGTLTNGGDSEDATFAAQAGSLAKIKVSSKTFDPVIGIFDPAGNPVPLSGYSQSGGKAAVGGTLLPDTGKPYETGDYTVRVTSANGGSGDYTLVAGVKAPKAGSLKLLDAQLLGSSAKSGVAPGGMLQLKVVGAGPTAADNVVVLGGRTLTPSSVSLKAGKGSLYVTVPGDMPYGPTTVSFLAGGEKSAELDLQIIP